MASAQASAVVHLVDDDAAVRESLAFMLDAEGVQCVTYDGGPALLKVAEALAGCVIVTDVRMPGMNGLELIAELRRREIAAPVIVLTGHADVALAVEAMKAGAFDFLEKPFERRAFLGAVQAALAIADDAFAKSATRAEIETRLMALTAREREVFDAIVDGESNKSAALKLGISPRTVEIYRANVMSKMQAASLSDLVRMAMQAQRD